MKKDYYAVLGVKPSASEKEIRSAYKKLAKKYHPDVNPGNKRAEERFKEISEAYDVLSDPEKKRRWESGTEEWGAGAENPVTGFGGTGGGFKGAGDFGSILEDLMAGMGGGAFGGAQSGRAGVQPGLDLLHEATIGFEDAARGTELVVGLARRSVGGRRSTETIHVRIPPGVSDGGRVRVPGKGDVGRRGGPPGDLYVTLRVAPHRYFRREGNDIVLDLPLTISEAALGTRIEVPTLDGRVTLTVPPASSSGQKLRLRGRGIAPAAGRGPRGDQIVLIQIVTPKNPDAKSRKLLEELQRLNPENPRADLGS